MRALWLAVSVVAVIGCGRTEVVRWSPVVPDGGLDGGFVEGGSDAGFADAGQSDGGSDAGIKPCVDGRFSLSAAEPLVMLVIDRSCSMLDYFPDGTTSKWNALRNALNQTLPTIDDTVQLGVVFFPIDGAANDCDVPAISALRPGFGHADIILNTLSSTEPRGATPTSAALRVAYDILQSRRTGSTARGMVLATDGEPTCVSANVVLNDLRTALDAGVPTWVVGIETVAAPALTQVLVSMANAGGRPRIDAGVPYFPATSAGALTEAFRSIRDQVAACSFITESVPDLDGGIAVTYGGQPVPYDPSGVSGWLWTDRNNGELVLRGAHCTRAIATPQQLQVVVSCSR